MSQAEIAGGAVTPSEQFPSEGHLLRDFALISPLGVRIHLSDYRGRSNLVLLVTDNESASARLMSDLAREYAEIRNHEAEVLAVEWLSPEQATQEKQQMRLPYPLLVDEDGRFHREVGATDAHGQSSAAVYVTDRFGEVFGSYRTRDGQNLSTAEEILNWLEFVNSQCPECEPPEWPA